MSTRSVFSILLASGFLASLTGCREDEHQPANQEKPVEVTAVVNEESTNWTEAEEIVASTVADVSAIQQSVQSAADISRGQDKIDYLVEALVLPDLSESEQELIRERLITARTKAANHFQNLTAESRQFSRPADFVRRQVSLSAWAVNVGI